MRQAFTVLRKYTGEFLKFGIPRRENDDSARISSPTDSFIKAVEALERLGSFAPEPTQNAERTTLGPVGPEIDHENFVSVTRGTSNDKSAQYFPAVLNSGLDIGQFERFRQRVIPLRTRRTPRTDEGVAGRQTGDGRICKPFERLTNAAPSPFRMTLASTIYRYRYLTLKRIMSYFS